MGRKERRSNTGKHQAGQHADGQHILFDLLSARGFRGPEDDALDSVVDAPTRLEGNGIGRAGQVVEICLEKPECLRSVVSSGMGRPARHGHGQRTSRAPLTDSSHRSIMNSSRAMDSLSMLMSRWHSLWAVHVS